MPVFSGSFEWDSGLVWPVVGFAAGDEPLGEDDLDDRLQLHAALVDTGASATCIILRLGVLTQSPDGHFSFAF